MADPEASRIFISYRREDTSGHVLALLPALRKHFGDRIFKDTDNIPPGEDFVKFIKRELDSCSVLLAIIGRDWLKVQDPRLKRRRLDDPDDFLRVEVSTALRSDRIRVIPVLVERGTMPTAADLPADLAELPNRNALELSDARWESDVQLLIQAIQRVIAPVEARADVPQQRPELQDLQKRRAREIAGHLAAAREAFEAQEYEATLMACEKALLLDPHGLEALELLDRTRRTIDELKIATWLKEATQALGRGDIGNASDFIDQALAIDPASEPALTLRKEMLALRRERERDRERARVVASAVARARTSLDEEDYDATLRHAEDALALDPESAEAQDLRTKAAAALDERKRLRELKRRAQQAVTEAREKFIAGEHDAALVLLREFRPTHDLVSQALADLEKEAETFSNLQRHLDQLMQQASTALAAGALEDASNRLAEVERSQPARAGVAELLREIEARRAAAIAAQNARRAADKKLAEATTEFERANYTEAKRLAEAALKQDPQHPDVDSWVRRIDAAAAAQLADRIATKAVARARQLFEAEDHEGALRVLREFNPPHRLVLEALEQLSESLREKEERRQRRDAEEAARRRVETERAAAARQRAEAIRAILDRGRAHLDREDFRAATESANELLSLDPDSAEGKQLRADADAALRARAAREEQERIAREAEERRKEEARQAEEARKAEEDARKAKEEARKAEARAREERERRERETQERARAEAAKRAEEQRLAEVRAREERQRREREAQERARAEAARRAEEQRLAEARAGEERERREREAQEAARAEAARLAEEQRLAEARARAEAEAERERERVREARIQQLLAEAESALSAKSFRTAKRRAAAVLELAPDNESAQAILASATRELNAAIPEFWSIRRYGGVGAAAVLVLGVAIGIRQFQQPSAPPAADISQGSNTPTRPATSSPSPTGPDTTAKASPPPSSEPSATPPSPSPGTATPPSASPGTTAAPSPSPDPSTPTEAELREERVRPLRQAARSHLKRGNREGALNSVAQGLQISGDDPGLRDVLDALLNAAQKASADARVAARDAAAAQLARGTLEDALKLEEEANRQRAANRKDAATRSFWKAEDQFDRAAREARGEQARLAKLREAELAAAKAAANRPPADSSPGKTLPPADPPARGKVESPVTATPPPVATAPAPAPAKPTVSRLDLERPRIAAILQRYAAAYDSLDANAVRPLFPANAAKLEAAFSSFQTYNLDIEIQSTELSTDGSTATVVARVSHNFQPKAGRRDGTTVTSTFTLQKKGNDWIIVQLK
jgi:tetratricopeptide (TPR) repeat protein